MLKQPQVVVSGLFIYIAYIYLSTVLFHCINDYLGVFACQVFAL